MLVWTKVKAEEAGNVDSGSFKDRARQCGNNLYVESERTGVKNRPTPFALNRWESNQQSCGGLRAQPM